MMDFSMQYKSLLNKTPSFRTESKYLNRDDNSKLRKITEEGNFECFTQSANEKRQNKVFKAESNLQSKMPNFLNNYDELIKGLQEVKQEEKPALNKKKETDRRKRKSVLITMTDSPLKQNAFAWELSGGNKDDDIFNFQLSSCINPEEQKKEDSPKRNIKRKKSKSVNKESSMSNN
jgi:hypothetical protein